MFLTQVYNVLPIHSRHTPYSVPTVTHTEGSVASGALINKELTVESAIEDPHDPTKHITQLIDSGDKEINFKE